MIGAECPTNEQVQANFKRTYIFYLRDLNMYKLFKSNYGNVLYRVPKSFYIGNFTLLIR